MEINFYKYQGSGNDFIILDNRSNEFESLNAEQVKKCATENLVLVLMD